MTSRDDARLARLLRAVSDQSIAVAVSRARVPKVLAGTVEFMNPEELDVLHVRVDDDAYPADPTLSMNYEAPGVIPTTRVGEAYTNDAVRITFDGPAGGTAIRTSSPTAVTYPYGAESGQRIVIDGETGTLRLYDTDDVVVGYLDPTQLFIGKPGEALARLDPLGGLRLRDGADVLRVQLAPTEGLSIRDPDTGISGLIANHDGLIVLDPTTGERISITSGGTSATPTPHWTSSQALNPGASLTSPAGTTFGTGDDIELRFICNSDAAATAGTVTPHAGFTEATDVNDTSSGVTLGTSSSYRDPAGASPGVATSTSTSSAWDRVNGHTVIISGGGGTSPAFRSASTSSVMTTNARSFDLTIPAPAGIVGGDMLVAFVAMVSPNVPVGWTTPDGWKQLGVQVAGLGTTEVLASGVWYSLCPPSPPASEVAAINMAGDGLTKVHATVIAVSNPFAYPGGLDIRLNNRSMPRGQIRTQPELTNTAAIAPGSMPFSMCEMLDVPASAGRNYRVEFNCPGVIFNAFNAACQWRLSIQRDPGTGYADEYVVSRRQMSFAGTEELPVFGGFTYTPVGDEVNDWRARLTNLVTSAGYTVQFLGSSSAPRSLTVTDTGAEF